MNSKKTENIEKRLGIYNSDDTLPDGVLRRYIPSYLYEIKTLGGFLSLCDIYVDRLVILVREVRDYWEIGKI